MERGQRFKRRALRRGYKADEVDNFLDRVEATLAGEDVHDPVGPDEVRDIIFKTRWGGYDEWHVDMELDRLERQLEELVDDPSSIRGSSGFPALGQRKSLALPAGSSAQNFPQPEAEDDASLAPGVYRSGSTDGELSFADLGSNGTSVRVGAAERGSRGASAQFVEPSPRSRPTPTPVSPAGPVARPRTRNVTPRPTVSPVAEAPQWSASEVQAAASSVRANSDTNAGGTNISRGRQVANPVVDPYAPRHGKTEMTLEVPTYGGDVSPFTQNDKDSLAHLQQTFKLRRFGSGYEPSQVERLWGAIAAAMGGQASATVTDADFDPRQFTLVQRGYFEQEVDAALAEMRELFRRRMG